MNGLAHGLAACLQLSVGAEPGYERGPAKGQLCYYKADIGFFF